MLVAESMRTERSTNEGIGGERRIEVAIQHACLISLRSAGPAGGPCDLRSWRIRERTRAKATNC